MESAGFARIPGLGFCRTAIDGSHRGEDVVADNFSFSVVLEPQRDGGFTVFVPALPEVVTEGDTEEEALANAEEAIRAILAYRGENRLQRPLPIIRSIE